MTTRRKRLLIALAVLLALSPGFWWLTRPVIGDPRFFGTWRQTASDENFGYRFDSDGTGVTLYGSVVATDFEWSAHDGGLAMQLHYRPGFWESITRFVASVRHRPPPPELLFEPTVEPFRFIGPELRIIEANGMECAYVRVHD